MRTDHGRGRGRGWRMERMIMEIIKEASRARYWARHGGWRWTLILARTLGADLDPIWRHPASSFDLCSGRVRDCPERPLSMSIMVLSSCSLSPPSSHKHKNTKHRLFFSPSFIRYNYCYKPKPFHRNVFTNRHSQLTIYDSPNHNSRL